MLFEEGGISTVYTTSSGAKVEEMVSLQGSVLVMERSQKKTNNGGKIVGRSIKLSPTELEEVYRTLNEWREESGETIQSIAEKIRFSHSALSFVFNRRRVPSYRLLESLCMVFHKTLEDLPPLKKTLS